MKEVYMTEPEVSKGDIFSKISQKKMTQKEAAEALGLSERHIRRLYAKFKDSGIISLISQQRGKPSNHQLSAGIKAQVSELVTIELYQGFGPTFMCEKLEERHGIKISVETTRNLMIENSVWKAHKKKCPAIHQQRKRRARRGELVQIDGSPHAWFENRGDSCVLISFVDDATGQTYGRFFKSETTRAYMVTAKIYFSKYGRPLAFYSDKHSIFRINKPGCLKKELITQFSRACKELDIDIICANSPQAKGRVEKNNRTQQDRLIKELRLAGISTIEKANKFLDDVYWNAYNNKFAILPESRKNAYRELLQEHDLKRILSCKKQRTLSKNLEVQCDNVIYQIISENPSWKLRRAKVTIIKGMDGEVHIEHNGKNLPFRIYSGQEVCGKEVNSKEVDRFLKEKIKRKVPYNHIWNQQGRAVLKMKQYGKVLQMGATV